MIDTERYSIEVSADDLELLHDALRATAEGIRYRVRMRALPSAKIRYHPAKAARLTEGANRMTELADWLLVHRISPTPAPPA